MFVRLLICVGLLTLLCFGLVGCGDEDSEVAELVQTVPASGERAAAHQPVVLYFDKAPLAVTVNGTAARVEGKRAVWCFPNPNRDFGNQLFHIKWTNPDGSQNVGTHIKLTVFSVHFEPPELTWSSINDGDADVDPDPLYTGDLRFYFNEPIIGVEAKLLTGDGKDLGWQAIWDDQSVTFLPDANAKLLENGTRYIVQMVVAEPWIYNEIFCECMDCSWYKNSEWTIGFITADQ